MTSFVTNLEKGVFSTPELYDEIDKVQKTNNNNNKRKITNVKHHYNTVLSTDIGKLSKNGVPFSIRNDEYVKIRYENGNHVYGGGILVSDENSRFIKEHKYTIKEHKYTNKEYQENTLSSEQLEIVNKLNEKKIQVEE